MLLKYIKNVGLICLFLGYIIFAHAFMTAYYSENKMVTISIDNYSEAGIEWWFVLLLPILTVILIIIIIIMEDILIKNGSS